MTLLVEVWRMTDETSILKILLSEYDKLKSEQLARIGFRDNLLYVTLGLLGAIISFSVGKGNPYAFLVIPWACLILGWTYLANDEKISAIGKYVRYTLTDRINKQISCTDKELVYGWETVHRSDNSRKRRKIEQLIIDEITFIGSGIVAIIAFGQSVSQPPMALSIVSLIQLVFLLILGYEIYFYADLKEGR
jgi:hypothetical protein